MELQSDHMWHTVYYSNQRWCQGKRRWQIFKILNISVQERVQSWSMRLLRLSPVPKIGMTFSAETGIKKREKKHAFMILQA